MAELLDPSVTFFSFREDGSPLGIGALKQLGPRHAEINRCILPRQREAVGWAGQC